MTKTTQYCACKVNLAGQNCHTVIFNEFNPVSWPEVQVLQALHGDENVMDIMPVAIGYVWPTQEKNRLISIYGHRTVEACFPGRVFRMDFTMTDDTDLPRFAGYGGEDALEPEPPKKKPEPKPAPVSEPDKPENGDLDDGEDEDDASAAAPSTLAPIFKPGRGARPTPHKGA